MERGRIQRLSKFFWVPPIISATGKAIWTSNFAGTFIGSIWNKSLLKIFEKRERGHIQGVSKFFGYPLLSQERIKLRTSNLVGTFMVDPNKKPWKVLGIVAVGVVRESRKFSRHPCIVRIARSSCDSTAFLLFLLFNPSNSQHVGWLVGYWLLMKPTMSF